LKHFNFMFFFGIFASLFFQDQFACAELSSSEAMQVFNEFVRTARQEKSDPIETRFQAKITVLHNEKMANIHSVRFENKDDHVVYKIFRTAEEDSNEALRKTFISHGLGAERAGSMKCSEDESWCKAHELSQDNYIVVPNTGILQNCEASFRLVPKFKIEDSFTGDVCIDLKTHHMTRQKGSVLNAGMFVKSVEFDRLFKEFEGRSIPLKYTAHAVINMEGAFDTTFEFSEPLICREAKEGETVAEKAAHASELCHKASFIPPIDAIPESNMKSKTVPRKHKFRLWFPIKGLSGVN
jgi:hypothetical protein